MPNCSRLVALIVWLLGLSWLLTACGFPASTPTRTSEIPDKPATDSAATLTAAVPVGTPTISVILSPTATFTPIPTQTLEPTLTQSPSPTPLENNVLGKICYPEQSIPAMNAYFENTETEALVEMPISAGQESYQIKLDSGTYIAYAWLPDFSRGGLYSRAVPCGLGKGCDDHTLLPFTVEQTEISQGIDLCDWYAGPFNVPYPPGKEQTEVTGVISGSLSHPDGTAVELRVVAFNVQTGYWYWVFAQSGQTFYSIQELPPGIYNVVAYDPEGRGGGYTGDNHNLQDVVVEPGKVAEGVNIDDWNIPAGAYPPDPTR
jgi:hypothetical protein